jgi:hypothetical protein
MESFSNADGFIDQDLSFTNLIISKKDEIFVNQEEIYKTLRKRTIKKKRTTFLYKVFSFLGVAST